MTLLSEQAIIQTAKELWRYSFPDPNNPVNDWEKEPIERQARFYGEAVIALMEAKEQPALDPAAVLNNLRFLFDAAKITSGHWRLSPRKTPVANLTRHRILAHYPDGGCEEAVIDCKNERTGLAIAAAVNFCRDHLANLQTPWRPISTAPEGTKADIWVKCGLIPSFREQMGFAEAERVPDCTFKNGLWYQDNDPSGEPFVPELVTHWMPKPPPPESPSDATSS